MNRLEDLVNIHLIDARFDKGCIYLNTSNNKCIQLTPVGDCCAHCYIENVACSEALFNATVLKVEDLEVPSPSKEDLEQYEVLDNWGHRIVTDKGICNIEMRVSHNGYYGGSLEVSWVSKSEAELLTDF